jgi:hypothetical protein
MNMTPTTTSLRALCDAYEDASDATRAEFLLALEALFRRAFSPVIVSHWHGPGKMPQTA